MLFKRIAYIAIIVIVASILINPGNAWRRRRRRRRRPSCLPTNCQMSSWSSWSPCSAVVCGNAGSRRRSRYVITNPSCGGAGCPSNRLETTLCFGTKAANCVYSTWSTWNACPPYQCGDTQTSRRYIISREQCGGTPCNTTALRKTRPCKQTFCVNQGTLHNGRCFCKTDYYGGCCQYKSKYACIHTLGIF